MTAIALVDVRLPDGRTRKFRYRADREWLVRSVLAGRYNAPPTEADARVRRVLDVGAGCGEFHVHAMVRWPGCWIDWVEDDEELAALCAENSAPGSKRWVRAAGPIPLEGYDVVRVATNKRPIFERSVGTTPILIWIEDWIAVQL